MSPQNPQLLYFLALAAIPVILHFLLRAKPKKLLFPALRLIQMQRRANRRRMRLRHLLLLLLRMAVIALIVIGLARPTVPSANYTPSISEIVTTLVILAAAAGGYWAMLRFWRRKQLPDYELAQRRSFLRGGVAVGTLVLFLLLVVWPFQRRISAAISQPTIQQAENLPVAAVFLFDTSLSMDFKYENKTRLERAAEIATQHLNNLPASSRIAISDTASNEPIHFSPDRAIAQTQIQELKSSAISAAINDRIRAVVDLQVDDISRGQGAVADGEKFEDQFVRELYIFTDLSQHAWQPEGARLLQNELERLAALGVYLIDVGVEEPSNTSLTDLRLSSQTVPQGGVVTVDAAVTGTGTGSGAKTVGISIQGPAGEMIDQGSSDVQVDQIATRVRFPLSGLTGPVVQGEVRLETDDSLSFDDAISFTIEVQPPKQVLIVSDNYATKANFFRTALSPEELELSGDSPYRTKVIDSAQFAAEDLSRFDVVCWLDVGQPGFADWRALQRFLEAGGGAILFLGPNVNQASYLDETAQAILPADLLANRPFREDEQFDLRNLTHPLLRAFAEWDTSELASVNVARHWRTKPADDATVIVPYTDANETAAIIERTVGQGRIIMITTPFDRSEWSNLVTSVNVAVVLSDQLAQYVSRHDDERYNYTAGQIPVIKLSDEFEIKQLLVRKPDRTQPGKDLPPGADEVVIDDARLLGNYRLIPRNADIDFERGFSINAVASESDLSRLGTSDLDALFGEGRYEAARDIDNLTRQVRQGRVGREIFPWVLAIMIGIFVAEHFVANYFYQTETTAAEDITRGMSSNADQPAA
ncbi:hypothetical protein Pan258_49990 [Symmachiella dynata]|uniref:vWA domain-containing protein n=1 Tax=Symmachiella dynata TaxID=2527995 RepID=UPI00118816B1|nr:BatA and WFA domain-containing protein [Symmachiella dynata]QDT50917.1 hypothetical protein Pan258_49990 [Symmachiella dynata]